MKGYTLVELLVSMTIFAIVMLSATAAYLSFIAYNRRAQTEALVMNSLSFAVDTMAREIRSGRDYAMSGSGFAFTNADGCPVVYDLNGTALERKKVGGAGTCLPTSNLTDAAITISSLKFFLRDSSTLQPIVTMAIQGSAVIPNTSIPVPFQIQTSATQRLPDL